MSDFRQDFLKFALAQNVLKFGEFTTKAGRQSPYFFNAGLFNDGASTLQLAKFYAQAIIESGVKFDMLFGPAYKGIILAAATAMMLAEKGVNVPFAYNRKEAKGKDLSSRIFGCDHCRIPDCWVIWKNGESMPTLPYPTARRFDTGCMANGTMPSAFVMRQEEWNCVIASSRAASLRRIFH